MTLETIVIILLAGFDVFLFLAIFLLRLQLKNTQRLLESKIESLAINVGRHNTKLDKLSNELDELADKQALQVEFEDFPTKATLMRNPGCIELEAKEVKHD